MVAIPEEYLDILQSCALAYVATTGPKGAAQVSPVWFVWEGGRILFSTTKARQKYRNILRESGVSVAITDPQNPYRSLEIRGTADSEDDHGYRAVHRITRKYMGHDATPEMLPAQDERVVITITPEQLLVFAH